jgi:hypothetical protein
MYFSAFHQCACYFVILYYKVDADRSSVCFSRSYCYFGLCSIGTVLKWLTRSYEKTFLHVSSSVASSWSVVSCDVSHFTCAFLLDSSFPAKMHLAVFLRAYVLLALLPWLSVTSLYGASPCLRSVRDLEPHHKCWLLMTLNRLLR